ncbi:MAG: MaoC family dehydratase N-terminal domain-containing protein [Proteobacteria bacterium]|nr:MaoC family dehydratase N-terminal domain-containing protein [Pseudomonadota bacterium]
MTFAAHSAVVEAGQLRFFAKAIGETNPIYFDESAARDAGHPTLPVPPTFFFSLELTRPESNWREQAGIQLPRVLHGEQQFTYHRMAYAGDTLHFEGRITDVYDKKNGALSFVVMETTVTNQRGEHVADIRKSLVHRNG